MAGGSLAGGLGTSLVRLELLVLGMGGDPLRERSARISGEGRGHGRWWGGPLRLPHPAWWMCVPLLVGLAGADWVRDPESRILCGRALTVACCPSEQEGDRSSVGGRFRLPLLLPHSS